MEKILFLILGFAILMIEPVHAKEDKMQIRITTEAVSEQGKSKTYTATLHDNETAISFKEMLPLTLEMSDLHGNEKKYDLPHRLPTKDANPEKIQAGDLMIWDSRTVVLFYKSFPTSYSYTKIGRINDASGLADAVGSGNVKVTFKLE
jgi:hypothetical protein